VHAEPGSPESITEILVFAVEEKAFVKTADTLESGAAYQHASSGNPFVRARTEVSIVIAHHLVRPRGMGQETVEEERPTPGRSQTRKSTKGEIERPVPIDDAWCNKARVGVFLERFDESLERRRINRGVWVQKENERRLSCSPTDVAAVSKAAVRTKLESCDRKVRNRAQAPVARGVVDNDHVGQPGLYKWRDAIAQATAAVVRDDYDID
jgi:hypothetical protein